MRTKLSESDRDTLVADYLAGEKLDVLAARYGVDPSYATVLAKRRGLGRHVCPHCGGSLRKSSTLTE